MQVNQERIMGHIDALSQFNATPDAGITRFSYSPQDAQARAYLMDRFAALAMPVHVDSVGNVRARYAGSNPSLPPLWIGSHIDSVRNGGMYDGVVGVVGALEVVSALFENEIRPRRSIEVVLFSEEEGSNFGTTMVGSKCLAGKLDFAGLERLQTVSGISCARMAAEFGLHPEDVLSYRLVPGMVDAMLELHIEQGIVLDRKKVKLGVVQAIAGMCTVRVTVSGESNHAGATPMNMRHDPMTAAARLILIIRDIAADQCLPDTVSTVGEISCTPNMPNVIPGEVSFTVDIRDVKETGIDRSLALLEQAMAEVSDEAGVQISLETIGRSSPVVLSDRVVSALRDAAAACGVPYIDMNSGAVHDAAMLAGVTDVGMIFVPSADGRSHTSEEYTAPEDIALGCQALLNAAITLTK